MKCNCLPYLIATALFCLASCHPAPRHEITRGFFYWKTRVALNGYEEQRLTEAGCKKIYLHLFDVAWSPEDSAAHPIAGAVFSRPLPDTMVCVPVVFITNEVFQHITDSTGLSIFSSRVAQRLGAVCAAGNFNPTEVQIDCDWTQKTRIAYFSFLQQLRIQPFLQRKILSVTIRLHQVKYPEKTGVPPIEKGLLMCYNMGNTRKPGNHNSILDADLAENYLSNLARYPIKLDIALPLFQWCLLFEGSKFRGILRDFPPALLQNSRCFRKENGLFLIDHDTLFMGTQLRAGMAIRAEQVTAGDVARVAAFAAARLPTGPLNVILFHADESTLASFTETDLEKIYSACR